MNEEVWGGRLLQSTHTPGDPCKCWEALLENVLGDNKVRVHYFRMEKQTQMPPVAKRAMYIYEAALSGYFLFSYLIESWIQRSISL